MRAKIEAKVASGGASALSVSKLTLKGKLLEEGKPICDYGVTDADVCVCADLTINDCTSTD